MIGHIEARWALMVGSEFLGRYCWNDGNCNEPKVRTFRTRKLAEEAKERLNSYKKQARIVRVSVTIE